jgi:methionine-rich copper-binding protein CopC
VVVLLLVPVAAQAHDSLVAVTPADAAVVEGAPSQVVLVFSAAVEPLGSAVVVRGADGRTVSQGSTRIEGTTLTQPLAALTADGTYYVSYRVVSSDGHPVSGTTTFVLQGVGPSMTALADPPTGVPTDRGGRSYVVAAATAAVVVLVLVALAVARSRRRVAT